ncbi:MAG: hypothetical protein NTY60_01885 [Proteobacteria bacterium]|nr:hypothetical protein [Pseudomonadota bacterium]
MFSYHKFFETMLHFFRLIVAYCNVRMVENVAAMEKYSAIVIKTLEAIAIQIESVPKNTENQDCGIDLF